MILALASRSTANAAGKGVFGCSGDSDATGTQIPTLAGNYKTQAAPAAASVSTRMPGHPPSNVSIDEVEDPGAKVGGLMSTRSPGEG